MGQGKRNGLKSYIRNTAIYARVSTQAREQLLSLGNQVNALTEMVASDPSLRLYDIYIDVESGYQDLPRKNMERLLNDCRAGNVDYILVKSISRLSRDTVHLLTFIRELRVLDVEIFFENEKISSLSTDAELIITMIGAIAQAESDSKSKNIKWGIDKAMKNPDSAFNNKLIYGYERDEKGQLIIKQDAANTVSEIFALYLEGKSILLIIEALKNKGIVSPRGNDTWSKRTIEKILADERYTGFSSKTIATKTTLKKIGYPTIIPRVIFLQTEKQRLKRSNGRGKNQ